MNCLVYIKQYQAMKCYDAKILAYYTTFIGEGNRSPDSSVISITNGEVKDFSQNMINGKGDSYWGIKRYVPPTQSTFSTIGAVVTDTLGHITDISEHNIFKGCNIPVLNSDSIAGDNQVMFYDTIDFWGNDVKFNSRADFKNRVDFNSRAYLYGGADFNNFADFNDIANFKDFADFDKKVNIKDTTTLFKDTTLSIYREGVDIHFNCSNPGRWSNLYFYNDAYATNKQGGCINAEEFTGHKYAGNNQYFYMGNEYIGTYLTLCQWSPDSRLYFTNGTIQIPSGAIGVEDTIIITGIKRKPQTGWLFVDTCDIGTKDDKFKAHINERWQTFSFDCHFTGITGIWVTSETIVDFKIEAGDKALFQWAGQPDSAYGNWTEVREDTAIIHFEKPDSATPYVVKIIK